MGTTAFVNGAVFDGQRYLGRAEVLVEDGKIRSVVEVRGAPATSLETTHETEVVDLAGGLLSPGFTDAHVHPIQGGLERLRCDLSEHGTREAYLAAIGAYALANPGLVWVLGGGWAMPAFVGGTPTAADLDSVVADRPAFFPNRDHHGAWVNSRALEIAGIDRDTPDPADGRIERDADGNPTGTLHEGAMWLVSRHAPRTSGEDYYRGLLEGQRYLHSVGVTGWQDAIVGSYAGMDDPGATYVKAAANGDLRSHVVGALWWERRRGVEQVDDLVGRREALSGGRFQARAVKVMQDGVAENFTASMLTPYLDAKGRETDNRGHSFVESGALREAVAALDAAGFQVHVHAIGDRASREALDAFEGLGWPDQRGPDQRRDHRHHIAHIQVVHPDDVPRFAALGVAANAQALWACEDEQMSELTLPFLGPERSAWQYPFGDLHRAGARLVMGSDWPVSSPDPLQAMHVAVNRVEYGQDRDPFLPSQSLDLETAFAAYTSGSAWINRRDEIDGAGRLTPGAAADLVVLDRDPFAGSPGEIGGARVVSTWIDGETVYEASHTG
jgi:predicted amidohydrolase YtcJ